MEDKLKITYDFIDQHKYGFLSTHSDELKDYPFGSIVPYVVTSHKEVAILISHLAQHTKNLSANNTCSISIFDPSIKQLQNSLRATLVGDSRCEEAPDQEDVVDRFFKKFPDQKQFFTKLNFKFHMIRPKKIHLVEGFGKVSWFDCE